MKCTDCKADKKLTDFSINKNKKNEVNTICKECQKKRSRDHYRDNKGRYYERNKKRKAEAVQYVQAIKNKALCPFCGENEPCCLDFHHVDRNGKKYDVASMVRHYSASSVKKEIDKCLIVCSNCHRKIHKGIISPASVMDARQASNL